MHHLGGFLLILTALLAGLILSADAGRYLLLGLVIGLAMFCLANLIGDHVSADARATRALRSGRVGEALEHFVPGKASQDIMRFLADALPGWYETQQSLQCAIAELTDLQRAIAEFRLASAGQALLDQVVPETRVAASALWQCADRLGAVANYRDDSEALRRSIERELATLDRIARALHTARVGLAELALTDGRHDRWTPATETAVIRLIALGRAASEMAVLEGGDGDDC